MQRRFLKIACSAMVSIVAGFASVQASAAQDYVEGVVRVKLQPEIASRITSTQLPTAKTKGTQNYLTTGITTLDVSNRQTKAVSITRVFPDAGKFEEKHKAAGLDLWYDIHYDASAMTSLEVRNVYRRTSGVTYAQRIPVYQPIGGESFRPLTADQIAAATKAAASSNLPFNDPLLNDQWHYNNDGHLAGSVAGFDANIFRAWETGITGSKDVVVAIIDGGFQTDHPDLKDNLWINEKELNGKEGVDDDGNGFVDDVYGWNFILNSSNINAHSHGTHVAGTVGATNGNGIGVCGVAGGNGTGGVKMMVCQIFDNRASSTIVGDYAGSLIYAADQGAAIAQCSWGMSTPDEEDKSITEAIKYFTQNGGGDVMNGGLCIFAAGNNGDTGNYFPGCLDDVVGVAAMGADGLITTYSNYGPWVDVTAPGGSSDYNQSLCVLSTLPNSTYGYNEGTSMACPHVSGVAALILSKYGNKNFSNETLRTLLTTSVNDIYTLNPKYIGQVGSGFIDAYKALQGKEGSTPSAVGDFTLTPSHDNVLIEWVIPDTEEKSIDHHVVYYSTEPFTASSDMAKINRVSVDTKFLNSGDNASYELTGLKATTTYYIALMAYNRWGQPSELSAVKSATTNAGPVVTLDASKLSLKVNAANSDVASGTFNISNTGEGLLKYELSTSTKSVTYRTNSFGNNPSPGKIAAHSSKLVAYDATSYPVISADYDATEWPAELTYSQYIYSYLGETDTEKPNALAQYFAVDKKTYPNGFNLTAVRFGGSGTGYTPTIEIYDGSRTISSASLLHSFTPETFAYRYDYTLDEQIYFEPGSSFWIVAKFPAGQINPLGAGYMKSNFDVAHYSFYSSDNGETWTQLSTVLKGSSYEQVASKFTWDVYAISKNPDWSKTLVIEPASGEIRKGESKTVKVANDGQKLVNGNYNYNIKVKTNEATSSNTTLDVALSVTGNLPVMSSAQLVDFGNVIVGQEKTITVELVNSGYGDFKGKYGGLYEYYKEVTSSSDQFKVGNTNAISARSKGQMDVTFRPTKGGDVSSTITLKSKLGVNHTFTVRGVATEPAKAEFSAESFDLGDLQLNGENKSVTFTLNNTGKYPLQYVFPKYSNQSIEGTAGYSHKFGYTYLDNFNGNKAVAYEPAPDLIDEVDITSQLSISNVWQSEAVEIGFNFPFYGEEFNKLYICSTGGVAMNKISGRIPSIVPSASNCNGIGYISAFATSGYLDMGENSKISYGHKDGKFVVKFQNVLTPILGGFGTTAISFHMVLHPNGNVDIFYDDYNPDNVFDSGKIIFVGMADVNVKDCFIITDSDTYDTVGFENVYKNFKSGAAIRFVAPAKSMIESVSSTDGYIGIGEQQDITITAKAVDGLNAGELINNLVLLTNDPYKASSTIAVKANIIGEGLAPVANLNAKEIDFGTVFRTSSQVRSVLLRNDGSDVLKVTSVKISGCNASVDNAIAAGFDIAAGDLKDVIVTLSTETEGEVNGVMTISFAEGDNIEIPIKGKVSGVPTINVNPERTQVTTPYGVPVSSTVNVKNNGNETLKFSVTPNIWFGVSDLTADDKKSSIDYIYKASPENEDVKCEWFDITSDYTYHMPYVYFADVTDFKLVTLPFEFPFYGKNYKEMYIYNTGFVSFDEPLEDYKQFPEPPGSLPSTETFYTNIICPFWGNHSMASDSKDGVYYKDCGDYVIVSFHNYGNSVMFGMNFQVIIYKDGSFKFQYKLSDNGIKVGTYGLCGIMDHSATRALCPPNSYIEPGNALQFYPVKSYSVAPNASANVEVNFETNRMAKVYDYNMELNTNVPGNETVLYPLSLEVTGEAKPVFPESIEIEQVADTDEETSTFDFEVRNEGTAEFTITNIYSAFLDERLNNGDAQLLYLDPNQKSDGSLDPGPLAISETGNWVPYYSSISDPIVVGKEGAKFRIMLYNTSEKRKETHELSISTEGLENNEIYGSLNNGVYTANINLYITEAPKLTFEADELRLGTVSNDYKGTARLNMSNTGKYKLTYSMHLNPSGNDEIEEVEEEWGGGGGIAPANNVIAPSQTEATLSSIKPFAASKETLANVIGIKSVKDDQHYEYDVPKDENGKPLSDTYNMLYYPVLNPVREAQATILGTGSDLTDNFYAATRYTSPEEGFNLTHLYFVGTVGNLKNVDIEASVILGDDVTSTKKTIGHGKIHVDKEDVNSTTGTYTCVPRMLEFDKPVYINPNDTFYVVLKYPAGYSASAMLATKDGEMAPGRYMAYLTSFGGWIDIEDTFDAAYSYGAFGYFMSCIEMSKGEPWIKLLNSETEGVLEVGESLPLEFAINAKGTYFDKDNRATLVVKSNDPDAKLKNYHIFIDKNAAPVISLPVGNYTVAENKSITVDVNISDAENEAFTARISDDVQAASVADYDNGKGSKEGITVSDEGVYTVAAGTQLHLKVTIAPDYGTAGSHTLSVDAEDAQGNSRNATLDYNVEFTNRAPKFIGASTIEIAPGQASTVFNFNELFTDPDGDEMTFEVSVSNTKLANVYSSETGFIIIPGDKEGSTKLKISACDTSEAYGVASITLKISNSAAIADIVDDNDNVDVINDNTGNLGFNFNEAAKNVTLRIFNNSGQLLAEQSASNVQAGQSVTVNVGRLATGVYHLVAYIDGKIVTTKFIND